MKWRWIMIEQVTIRPVLSALRHKDLLGIAFPASVGLVVLGRRPNHVARAISESSAKVGRATAAEMLDGVAMESFPTEGRVTSVSDSLGGQVTKIDLTIEQPKPPEPPHGIHRPV